MKIGDIAKWFPRLFVAVGARNGPSCSIGLIIQLWSNFCYDLQCALGRYLAVRRIQILATFFLREERVDTGLNDNFVKA